MSRDHSHLSNTAICKLQGEEEGTRDEADNFETTSPNSYFLLKPL